MVTVMKMRPLHIGLCVLVLVIILGVSIWLITSMSSNTGIKLHLIPSDGTDVISYDPSDQNSMDKWIFKIREFLKPYEDPNLTPGRKERLTQCDYKKPVEEGKVCEIDIQHWLPCTAKNRFSYHRETPCIFLTIDKLVGWTPEYYDPNELPDSMPKELRDNIQYQSREKPENLRTLWLSCEGVTKHDAKNVGSLFYIPVQGFQGYFFPYNGTEGYLSPIVAINFENGKAGTSMKVVCKAWAKNINHEENSGILTFQMDII